MMLESKIDKQGKSVVNVSTSKGGGGGLRSGARTRKM